MEKESIEKFHAIFEYGATVVYDPAVITILTAKGFGIMTLRDPAFVANVLLRTSMKKPKKKKKNNCFTPATDLTNLSFGSPAVEVVLNDVIEEDNEVKEDEEVNSIVSGGADDADIVMDEDVDDEPADADLPVNDQEEIPPEPTIELDEEIPLAVEEADAVVISPIVILNEEAFYLASNDLITITMANEPNKPLSLDELWTLFYQFNPSFPIFYYIYNYFRSQKWVIRNGFNYGMDYCLYRDLPGKVHSEICVRVINSLGKPTIMRSDGQSNQPDLSYRHSNCAWKIVQDKESSLSWRTMSTITRIMPDVMKLGLLCYVLPVEDAKVSNKISHTDGSLKYGHLFDINEENGSSQSTANAAAVDTSNKSTIDLSTSACLNQLMMRPVTVMTRRHCIGSSKDYPSVTSIQKKLRHQKGSSAGRKARTSKQTPKKIKPMLPSPPAAVQEESSANQGGTSGNMKGTEALPGIAMEAALPSSSSAQQPVAVDETSAPLSGKKRTAEEISTKVLQKKSRKRRDIEEVRTKKVKNQTIWHVLAK